jgi:2-polyprenyl-6-methoxyphenol hydroxylase-like FAD-dependent oxidoreductase
MPTCLTAAFRLLVQSLPASTIHYSHKVVKLQQADGKVVVTAEVCSSDGGGGPARQVTFEGDLLLGADGINSSVRSLLLPDDQKRYAGTAAAWPIHRLCMACSGMPMP